jgi:hypothetical protein
MRPTILICTPDIKSPRFHTCLDSVLETTQGEQYDLHIVDNRRDPNFSHQRELNRVILTADGPIITLDDDVIVSGNWYQALLYQARCNVGHSEDDMQM